ncbi:MAG: hypothetical protein LBU50_00850, partial [Cellulomonas sp.]|nr:hypothetical protein [Cellulomonas sp.]
PALRLEGVVIVGQRLVRQIVLSPGRRLTSTQLDVLARRTSKVLGHAVADRPQAAPTVVPDPAPDPAAEPSPLAGASSPFNRPSAHPAPPRTTADGPRKPPAVPGLRSEPGPEPTEASAAAPEPAGPERAAAPELMASVPAPTSLVPTELEPTELEPNELVPAEHHDQPPPPLPTPEEMGLPPALEHPAERHQTASADPIWPIAPPPGLWSAPEPEPELARLVASAGTDLDEPDAGESDLEHTRVVQSASTVPEVDEDESAMGRTRVVDLPRNRPPVATPDGGPPRLYGPPTPAGPSEAARLGLTGEDGLDLRGETTPETVGGEYSRPAETYPTLDDDVELTRIRPPDRPPASQSLADARRAFFSGGDGPVGSFPQDETFGSHPARHPAQVRPAARLSVAWDDDPTPPSDRPRPPVAWDPPEAPPVTSTGINAPGWRTGEPPRVTWDDPAAAATQHQTETQHHPETQHQPETPPADRPSVVAGPRPPVDHRPVEHTERPAQPVGLPSRHRPGRPAAGPAAGPAPQPDEPVNGPSEDDSPAPPRRSAPPQHPPRPHAARTGPWNLSPAQAAAVGGRFPGPMRLRGAFGTGRSVAAAYRAVHLAQSRSGRSGLPGLVAIVVPSATQVEPMLRRLASVAEADVLERIVVDTPAGIAQRLLAEFGTEVNPAPESVARAWSVAQRSTGLAAAQGRSIGLLLDEVALIRGRSLTDEADYDRLRPEMPPGLRHQVWVLHEAYLAELRQRNLPDEHDLVRMARAALRAGMPSELTAVVVDDANDLTVDQLTMLRETVGTGADAMTLVDDGLPGLLPVGATLGEAGIDIAQRQVDLTHEFRLTGPTWTSLVRLLQTDTGRDLVGTTDRPRLAGRLDDGEGPAYLRSQAIRLRRDRLVERVAELVGEGVPPQSIALLHIEDEPEPELVAELVRAGVMVRGLDALDMPAVALGRARDARGVEFDHVLVPDARHRDVVPVGGLRWDQRQRRRLLGLALSRSRETVWIAGV